MNKYRPHILILAEDDANNDIANGFMLHDQIALRQITILPPAGGWLKVQQSFISEYVATMQKYPKRYMVLLIDFDKQHDRLTKMTEDIPNDVADRVFVVGLWSEPEDLPGTGLGSKETLGLKLANECFDGTRVAWNHGLLEHNADELARMTAQLRPILFPAV